MERRKWTGKEKFEIVLEGLRSGKIAQICNKYEISQGLYYKWRDEFFSKGPEIFGLNGDKQYERLKKENTRLKTIIGELTTELKKTITSSKEKIRDGAKEESGDTGKDRPTKK